MGKNKWLTHNNKAIDDKEELVKIVFQRLVDLLHFALCPLDCSKMNANKILIDCVQSGFNRV